MMIIHHHAPHIMPEATYYTDKCRDANGHTPAQNERRYGLCAAMNGIRLGSRVLVSRSGSIDRSGSTYRPGYEKLGRPGRRSPWVIVTITDRIGHGSSIDLRPKAARAIMGNRYKIIGRIRVNLRVVYAF